MTSRTLHRLGVISGLAAGAWMGAAEVPVRLISTGYSPYLVSLGMVAGVFTGRWTLPMILKGTRHVVRDLGEKPHLIVWAILAGLLWAVANTLTIFAIRDVGLSVAFPLWNINSLVGLFWGWLLFGELRASGRGQGLKVLGGAVAVVAGACIVALAGTTGVVNAPQRPAIGIAAALGAALLWGTMYVPYRKAYLSGMNPLSFVTVFTFGELIAVLVLALWFDGGIHGVAAELSRARPALFWLFLGGLCWVVGDLFQQYATKYIGIGRGIPISNTNQLWGLAWGALAFGELRGKGSASLIFVAAGSLLMAAGALAIGMAEAPEGEHVQWTRAVERESRRYGFNLARALARFRGEHEPESPSRDWWEFVIAVCATGILLWLAREARAQPVAINACWTLALSAATLAFLLFAGIALWRRTRFL